MKEQTDIFHIEEAILKEAFRFLEHHLSAEKTIPFDAYQQLTINYSRLLKQTKMLIKMNDKQLYLLNDRVATIARTSEQILGQFLEAIPIGIFVIDSNGIPYYSNQKAQQIFGQDHIPFYTESLSKNYRIYLAGTQFLYPREKQPIARALQGESVRVDDMEIHKENQIIPIEVWGTPIFNEEGKVTYAVTAFHDISERRQAEVNKIRLIQEQEAKYAALCYSQEIELKNTELVRLNQEKNEFLGIVSHDLKNPLSGILGLTEIMQDSVDTISKEEMFDYLEMIKNSAETMFHLIIKLLDVNAIESGKVSLSLNNIDISELIQILVKNYQSRAQLKNIHIDCQIDRLKYRAYVDRNIAQQILDNLISNAIKYSPQGKTVYVRIFQDNQFIRCEVQDEGKGLSQADQAKLFGKFTRLTTKPTGGEHSAGLGLFIVKKLVGFLHGEVWCESELGNGATFVVTFPVAKE